MRDEYRPRPNDHIVEPVFGALRPDGEPELTPPGRGDERGPTRRGTAWKLPLAALCLFAVAWVVWRVVAA